LIDIADVITMRIPFPNTRSELAFQAHMYICIQNGNNKEFIKCQRFKTAYLLEDSPLNHILIEEPNKNRNPFIKITIIDCDKSFCVCYVITDKKLLATRNVCNELLDSIMEKINHSNFFKENLDPIPLCELNCLIRLNK